MVDNYTVWRFRSFERRGLTSIVRNYIESLGYDYDTVRNACERFYFLVDRDTHNIHGYAIVNVACNDRDALLVLINVRGVAEFIALFMWLVNKLRRLDVSKELTKAVVAGRVYNVHVLTRLCVNNFRGISFRTSLSNKGIRVTIKDNEFFVHEITRFYG